MIKNIFFLITVVILCFTYTKKLKAEEIYCGDGSVGNTVYCDISEDGKTLTISGNGKMQEYYYTGSPFVSRYPELTTLIVNEGVTSIGSKAFTGASSLTSITIPDSVKSIGYGAFNRASSLTSITIPEGVTYIDTIAFSGASSLESITIPDSVTSIGAWAFEYTGLKSITIPEGVTSIGQGAFQYASSLESIIIPDNINTENWNIYAFQGLPAGTNIVCQGDLNTCYENLARYIPTDKGGSCTSNCIKKEIQPAQSSQCNGSYIYENGNCHKRNEEQCNATGKYYYNGATCLYRPRNRQVVCVNPNYKANDGYCDRLRYTPAEAAQVLRDDNTNSVTITFKM